MCFSSRLMFVLLVLGWSLIAAGQEPDNQPPNTLSEQEKADGWKLLFDGQTTNGWRGYNMDKIPPGWEVIEGALVKVKPGAGGKGAGGGDDIITVGQYDHFEFTVQWKIVSNGNSGILYRVTEDAVTAWHVAPEMQVLDNTKHPTRKKSQLAGALYDLYEPEKDVTKPVGQWNTAKVVAVGNHVEHWLNGVKVVEYDLGSDDWKQRIADSKFQDMPQFATATKGHLCLQDHSDRIEFRNIKVRPLTAALGVSDVANPTALAAAKLETDVVYGHKDGLALTMDIYRPEAEANGAAIAFMVSGGWYSRWAPPDQAKPLFQPYLDRGYTMIAVRHGSSPRYSIPEAVADVRRAVRFIRQNASRFHVDADRLGVLGMSAGGHLALMLGTSGDDGNPTAEDPLDRVSSRVSAVVALVPPTDLRVAVWESPESLPAYRNFPALNLPLSKAGENSPLVQVTKDDAPALVIMGGKDDLVPAKHGRWIDDAFQKLGVQHKLIVFPDAGHGLEGDDNRATLVREAIGWFDSNLVSP